MRHPLRKVLMTAWTNAIESDYVNQRINSERSLQASFWAQLNSLLDPKSRRLFIEPGITIRQNAKSKTVFPDVIICNTREIIGVVELKYLPKAVPRTNKDLTTLDALATNRSQVAVCNSRFRGVTQDAKVYSLAENALFVWAGVHRREESSPENGENRLLSNGIASLDRKFLELHAATGDASKPEIYARW